MWNSQQKLLIECSECSAHLPESAEACPDCGYPVTAGAREAIREHSESVQASLKEYKLLRILGAVVVCGGIGAAWVDSPLAAGISITIGVSIYCLGLLGSWWNRID